MELTIFVTSEPYFACELGIFEQSEGAPIGGPLSGLLADLVLENLLEAKIRTHPVWAPPANWVRKADVTFFEWTESLDLLEEFHAYLNSLHPTTNWKLEVENDNKIPFLDILIIIIPTQQFIENQRPPTATFITPPPKLGKRKLQPSKPFDIEQKVTAPHPFSNKKNYSTS
jgi:hypothetical protein